MSEKESSSAVLIFWIPGRVTPKARPRVTRNGVYFPKSYQRWRAYAQKSVLLQVPAHYPLPIKKAAVHVILVGQLRGDSDNCFAAVADLLVKDAKILLDDRISCLPELSFKAIAGKAVGVEITIIPLN